MKSGFTFSEYSAGSVGNLIVEGQTLAPFEATGDAHFEFGGKGGKLGLFARLVRD